MASNIRSDKNLDGKTLYGQNVLSSIVGFAVKEVEGVNSLADKGVKLSLDGRNLVVDTFVNVVFGVKCSEIAFKVQENVRRSVESMTNYKVVTTNVNVLGVSFKDIASSGYKQREDFGTDE